MLFLKTAGRTDIRVRIEGDANGKNGSAGQKADADGAIQKEERGRYK